MGAAPPQPWGWNPSPPTEHPVESGHLCILLRMTTNGLAAVYRRYNACCNEHRFEDLHEFVAPGGCRGSRLAAARAGPS